MHNSLTKILISQKKSFFLNNLFGSLICSGIFRIFFLTNLSCFHPAYKLTPATWLHHHDLTSFWLLWWEGTHAPARGLRWSSWYLTQKHAAWSKQPHGSVLFLFFGTCQIYGMDCFWLMETWHKYPRGSWCEMARLLLNDPRLKLRGLQCCLGNIFVVSSMFQDLTLS